MRVTNTDNASSGKRLKINNQDVKTADYGVAIVAGVEFAKNHNRPMIATTAYTYKDSTEEYWNVKIDFKKYNGNSLPVTISILLIRNEMGNCDIS